MIATEAEYGRKKTTNNERLHNSITNDCFGELEFLLIKERKSNYPENEPRKRKSYTPPRPP